MKMTDERIQEIVGKFLRMMESDKFPQAIARTVIHRQQEDIPSANWSTANQVLMMLAGTNDARGIRQWNAVGRRVKKGAKAFYILAPRIITKSIEEENPETGEIRLVQKEILAGFLAIPVFRYEDTEGEPLEIPDYKPREMPPLANLAEAWGIKIRYGPFRGRFYGYYNFGSKEIFLATHDELTFFHELAHAAHHKIEALKGGQNPREEIIAETAAAALCILYGFEGYSCEASQYVRGYAKETSPQKALRKICQYLDTVQKVLSLILGEAERLAAKSEDEKKAA